LIVFIALGLTVSLVIAAIAVYIGKRAFAPPRNRPDRFLKSRHHGTRTVIVCLGDSITHGHVSHNYVDMLEETLSKQRIAVVNAGMNGDLAYNLLSRMDGIVQCQPDVATILIGTNDVGASISEKSNDFYVKLKKLPERPTLAWFELQLRKIITRLKKETRASIAVSSLPVLGEDLSSLANRNTRLYSESIKKITSEEGIAYLPLNEEQRAYLEKHPSRDAEPFTQTHSFSVFYAIIERYLFGRSLDEIGRRRGFQLTCEGVHMNRRGAEMIYELSLEFIRQALEERKGSTACL